MLSYRIITTYKPAAGFSKPKFSCPHDVAYKIIIVVNFFTTLLNIWLVKYIFFLFILFEFIVGGISYCKIGMNFEFAYRIWIILIHHYGSLGSLSSGVLNGKVCKKYK